MRILSIAVVGILVFCGIASAAEADLPITVSRPLRYSPEGQDFVIENGDHWFNRPLYGPHTAFHIDGGDKPEWALLVTAIKDGVIRMGLSGESGEKWLTDARRITTRYRPGSLIYEIADPLLGDGVLELRVMSMPDAEGVVVRAEVSGAATATKLVWVFGGVGSLRNSSVAVTAGDVITRSNVNSIRAIDEIDGRDLRPQLMLRAEQCKGNKITVMGEDFEVRSGAEGVGGRVTGGTLRVADAAKMDSPVEVLKSSGGSAALVVGEAGLTEPFYLGLWRKAKPLGNTDLAGEYAAAEKHRREIVSAVVVDTPDEFINAVPAAIAIAGDACWQPPEWVHGAVSWRTPLLGWRGAYIGDALGWHDRAEAYFRYWAGRQNTRDDFPTVARANPARNLAENDGGMLHSNGSIPASHYDMNLVYMDALFRHLLWTGDRKLATDLWPVIQRHLAWEKRCFDRDGLYEGYACIWASDALQYNGGGAAHSTAYNEFHNRMAARVARWIGQDATPYEKEAARIHEAMQGKLWMANRGWYAEYLDVMGEKQLHPAAALWSVYHPVDSGVPDAFGAWQCMRYVDTSIAHIPVRGPGVPVGDFHVLPESNWMPYEWSLNNVVTAENTHTALAYWEAGRAREGFDLFKSVMLDTMYLGNTPGNLPNLSAYDPYRGETYTDFADPTGITSRALVEGLFGIRPDAIDGEVVIRPGFPVGWDHASISTHDLSYTFRLSGERETWEVESKFSQPMRMRLQLRARGVRVQTVTVNGNPAAWKNVDESIGEPEIEIATDASSAKNEVTVQWAGASPATLENTAVVEPGGEVKVDYGAATFLKLYDPQNCLRDGKAVGLAGHRTAFAQVRQGDLTWWIPVEFEIRAIEQGPIVAAAETGKWEMVDLSGVLNDKVTNIFLNDYVSPRPQTCSLQMPLHGIGDWTGPTRTYAVDDSGLRREAGARGVLVLPDKTPLRTPGIGAAKNIAFTSQWDNYPRAVTAPLSGTAQAACFLLAGSTNAMESRLENGEIVVAYADGTSDKVALVNPTNWWPIDKNYRIDSYAFRRPGPVPMRVALGTGEAYVPNDETMPRGGSATVLRMRLEPGKELKSVTLHTESYEIAMGMMSVSLERP